MLAPAVVARLIAWHAWAHIGIGFTCEIVYLYREHLEVVLADTAILQLVRQSQLCLVLVEGFLARFTLNTDEKQKGLASNFIDEAAIMPQWNVFNIDQVEIHAHVLLATRRKSAWLLIEDLDEYLVMQKAANVQRLLPDCFHGLSAEIEVVPAWCDTCVATDKGSEISVWLNTSETARHPLHQYQQQRATNLKKKYPHYVVKSLVRPDRVVSFEIHIGTLRGKRKPLQSDVASKCGMNILHVVNMHKKRNNQAPDSQTKNDWRWMLGVI